MQEYTVNLSSEDNNADQMTVTLSRPLPRNQLLLVSSDRVLPIPIYLRDKDGRMIKRDIPDNEFFVPHSELILSVYLDPQTNGIDAYCGRSV